MADENSAPVSSGGESAEGPAKAGRLRVTIRKWHSVGLWKWDVNDECCGICRMAFDGYCGDCKMPGDDCPPIWGACNHAFHMHCIMKWLGANAQQQCPMCRSDWRFRE